LLNGKSISEISLFQAKDEKLWTLGARKELVKKLLEEWIMECEDEATVEGLLTGLSHENFTDVKLKIEGLINLAC
jgi:hypothetical protein